MKNVLDHSVPYLKYFEEMTRIPHGSRHESEYSKYLAAFAEKRGLKYRTDSIGNVVIYKDASAGCAEHAPVILQAHTDMVCAKTPESSHDFARDPLDIYVEDGFLRARGTTLGGDDGVGVAYMLSILDDDSLPHPPLECAFTVQEEVGLLGAAALRRDDFSAHRMIGLDDVGGGTTYVSAAGGRIVEFSKTAALESSPFPAYRLDVGGLRGGHSGADIDKGRASAIRLLFRTLFRLSEHAPLYLSSAEGGSAGNAIPMSASAVFSTPLAEDSLLSVTRECLADFRREFEAADDGVTLAVRPCSAGAVMSEKDSRGVVSFFRFLPDGFRRRSASISGLTTASSNLGVLRAGGGEVFAECMTRAALPSYIAEMEREQRFFSGLFGFGMNTVCVVPPFDYEGDSALRRLLGDIFRAETGRELVPIAVHGGIEAGYFRAMRPDMDIVTIGPLVLDEHMPTERLSLESFGEIYRVVLALLKAL
jgi:dipeptidase D